MPFDTLPATDVNVVELRQYTMSAGGTDELVRLFQKFFIEGQEAAGMRILGMYRDTADPNRFVWLRGFRDMAGRKHALESFYGSPIWRAHRPAAVAKMVDADDVLMLRPVDGARGELPANRWILATVWLLREPVGELFERQWRDSLRPAIVGAGITPLGAWRTEYARNDVPNRPVREGENAFVWLAAFDDRASLERAKAALAASAPWRALEANVAGGFAKPPQALVLDPAPRTDTTRDGRHDFDFLEGRWQVANRRLLERGVGSTRWDEFPATTEVRTYLGSVVDTDVIHFPTKGWSGFTLRSYDLERREWNIWWINSRDGKMQSPVTGNWHGDTGTFVGVDEDGGRPIRVIYTWKRPGPDAGRWEQAFSYDGGHTWETNWTMDSTRITPAASGPAPSR